MTHEPSYDPDHREFIRARSEQQLENLKAALEKLGDEDRQIVELRTIEQRSNREVAQILGLSDQAASMRYLRAMRRLRKLMPDDQDD